MYLIKCRDKEDGSTFFEECEDNEIEMVLEHIHLSPASVIWTEHYNGSMEENQYWR